MSEASTTDRLIAEAYSDASLSGADMRLAVADLESLRERLRDARSLGDVWEAGNATVAARYPEHRLIPVLTRVRDALLADRLGLAKQEIDQLAHRDESGAAEEWVNLLAEAAADSWYDVLLAVADWAAGRAFLDRALAEAARSAAHAFAEARFVDAAPLVEQLAALPQVTTESRFRLLLLLGEISLFRADDLVGARRRLAEARALLPQRPESLVLEGDCAARRSDWVESAMDPEREAFLDEGERLYEAAEENARRTGGRVGPAIARRGDVLLKRASAHQLEKDERDWAAEAESCFRAAVAQEPWHSYHLRSLAGQLIRAGAEPSDAEVRTLLDLARTLEPDDEGLIDSELGTALLEAGHLDPAREAIARAVAAAPRNLDVINSRSLLLQTVGELDAARDWLAESEERVPGTYELARAAAWLAEAREDWEEAVRHHELALERRPSAEAAVRSDLAWVQLQAGRPDLAESEAVAACRRVLADGDLEGQAVNPATARLLDVVQRLSEPEDVGRAFDYLDLARELRGDVFEADYRNRRGVVLHTVGRYEEAVTEYEASLRIDADAALTWRNLQEARFALGDWEGAEKAAERAFALDGDEAASVSARATASNLRGNEAFGRGDYSEAVSYYRETVELDPDDAVTRGNLGTALLLASPPLPVEDATSEALTHFERAAELSPEQYADDLASTRRRVAVIQDLGSFVLEAKPFWRLRVFLSEEVVPVFVDQDGQLLDSVNDKLAELEADFAYGRERPAVLFAASSEVEPGAAVVIVNGEVVSMVGADTQEAVIEEIGRLLTATASGFVGPDAAWQVVADEGREDLLRDLSEPDALLSLTWRLRTQAAPGRRLADVFPAPEASP